MIKKTLLTIGIILFSFMSYAQIALEHAQSAFSAGNYSDAAQLYEIIASTSTDQAEREKLYDMANKSREISMLYEQADNARKVNDYRLALECYEKILKYNPNDPISKTRKNECVYSIRNAEEIAANSQKTSGNNNVASGKINGHEYVDLGLSVKWATCNVGASSPEDYGNYYAWGETTTTSDYSSSNSKTYGKSINDIKGNSQYDAARANWGGDWRMPTKEEMRELIDKCTWIWTTQNGVKGYKVTSKTNGNSIFLPAAGCRLGSSLDSAGSFGYYWSSSPGVSGSYNAYYLYFGSGSQSMDYYGRRYGRSVRPVLE